MRKKQNRVGRAEAEVLRYIADKHPVTVREVADYFAQTKGLAKTTILNVMERLREKGFLTRESGEGGFRYSPSQSKGAILLGLVGSFVDEMLGGSLEPFMAYLAQKETIDEAELMRLKAVIAQLEANEAAQSAAQTPSTKEPK